MRGAQAMGRPLRRAVAARMGLLVFTLVVTINTATILRAKPDMRAAYTPRALLSTLVNRASGVFGGEADTDYRQPPLWQTAAFSDTPVACNETVPETCQDCAVVLAGVGSYADCAAVVSAACDGNSFIPYHTFHYCTMEEKGLGWLSIIVMIVLTAFYFIALGVAAESFFCPALSVISDSLNLSQNVAGVTLLALGNGAPDLFSSFSATTSGSADLAIGGAVGSGLFITTVCVGGVAFLAPFKVTRRPFLRDVFFYLVALLFLLLVLWDGKITLWESIFLIVLYVLYVIVVVAGRRINKRIKQYYREREAAKAAANPSLNAEDAALLGGEAGRAYTNPVTSQSSMDVLAPKPWHEQTTIVNLSGPPIVFNQDDSIAGDNKHATGSLEAPLRPIQIKSLTTALEYAATTSVPDQPMMRSRANTALSARSTQGQTPIPSTIASSEAEQNLTPLQQIPSIPYLSVDIRQIFPTLMNWREKTLVGKIMSIVNAPIVFVLAITVPVVEVVESSAGDAPGAAVETTDIAGTSPGKLNAVAPALLPSKAPGPTEAGAGSELGGSSAPPATADKAAPPEDDDEIEAVWNRYMFTFQCFLIPNFFVFGLGFWSTTLGSGNFPVWALTVILGAGLGALAWFTTKFDRPPVYNLMLAYIAFGVSIIWIYLIADELVASIQTLGAIFNIEEAILGITILAWGNSVGDFVANLTVAKMGFANMAVSASFGGPMLNLLLGIGISCMVQTIDGADYKVNLTMSLAVSILTLMLILIISGIYIPLNGYGAARPYGIFLLICFTISTVLAVTLTALNCSIDGCE